MDVSVVIVNYNTKKLTLDCIQSVLRSEGQFEFEIILIDNASADDTVEVSKKRFPQVRIVSNPENVGFSKANNQGIRLSRGRYILLLNSDTVVEPKTLWTMVQFMDEHREVGASGCKLLLENGTLDETCKRGFPTPMTSFYYIFGFSKMFPNVPQFHQYRLTHLDPDQTHRVDSLVGAFMFVRGETIARIGMLDESFFMYGEDIDWCYRMKQAGWQVVYYPQTTVIHCKGASSKTKPFKIVYEFYRAMVLFHHKHYARKYNVFVNSLVYSGVVVAFAVAFAGNLLKNRIRHQDWS